MLLGHLKVFLVVGAGNDYFYLSRAKFYYVSCAYSFIQAEEGQQVRYGLNYTVDK